RSGIGRSRANPRRPKRGPDGPRAIMCALPAMPGLPRMTENDPTAPPTAPTAPAEDAGAVAPGRRPGAARCRGPVPAAACRPATRYHVRPSSNARFPAHDRGRPDGPSDRADGARGGGRRGRAGRPAVSRPLPLPGSDACLRVGYAPAYTLQSQLDDPRTLAV